MDSKEIDNQHEKTDGLGGESAISPTGTQNAFQDEHDQQQFLEEEETMLDFLCSDTQSDEEDSEGDCDQSEKQKQERSEKIGSNSEMVEGESSQVQRLVLTMDSKGIDNQHDTTDGLGGESAISPTDTQNAFQDEHDQQQLLEEEETMLDFLCSDTQSEEEDSEGDGDQSEKRKPECSEKIGSNLEVVEGESSQVQRLVLSPGSKSQGVTYNKNNQHWEAHIWIKDTVLRGRKKKGVQIFAGNYSTEDDAKQAHDRLAIKFDIRETKKGKPYSLNFPESAQADYLAEHRDWSLRDFLWLVRRSSCKFSRGKSNMKGVTVRTPARKRLRTGEEESGPENRYAAKVSQGKGQDKKTANIGTYGSEEEAGQAYDRALLFINKDKGVAELWHVITNFRPSDYTDTEILEAGSKLVFKTCKAREMHAIPN